MIELVELNDEIYYLPPRFINGFPRPFWRVYKNQIMKFIEKYNLKPALTPMELLKKELEPMFEKDRPIIIRIPPFPGDKGPHLHYEGQFYPLTSKQWMQFTKPILKEIAEKLEAASTVQFEQFMDITDTMDAMGELLGPR